MVNLTIDGRAVQAKKGSTILDVARENGIFIPTSVTIRPCTPSAPAASAWWK